jgi:hypothetical protein
MSRLQPWRLFAPLTTTPSSVFISPGEEIPVPYRMTSEQLDAIRKGTQFGYIMLKLYIEIVLHLISFA